MRSRGYRLTVRSGPKVEHLEAPTLDAALTLLEQRGQELAAGPGRSAVDLRTKRFEPVAQVASRLEIRGPGVRGGADVRGDGSVEAWTGAWSRRVVEQEKKETAYAALRRALGAGSESAGP